MVRNEYVAKTSKSPLAVVRTALVVAKRALPAYSHRCSPKKFTQHQLFACLVLKNFLKTDYRGVCAALCDCPALREVLGLEHVPHYTTLQKAAQRLLVSHFARKLLSETVRLQLGRRRKIACAAIDSTGLECTMASSYFVRRRAQVGGPWKKMVYHRFPKLSVVCDVASHFILAYRAHRGPKPDITEFKSLLDDALQRVRVATIVADGGYDSESNHVHARTRRGVRTIIPPVHGRPTTKPAQGHHRRLMQVRFDHDAYRKRGQVETVMSMLKRRQGAHIRAVKYHSQCRSLGLMVLTHNIMILLRRKVFYRAGHFTFLRAEDGHAGGVTIRVLGF